MEVEFRWEVTPEQAWGPGSDNYVHTIEDAIYRIARQRAPQIVQWMKTNAPWTDRTGRARATLHAEVEMLAAGAMISLLHGVPYGEFLELAHGSRFAILGPALDYWGPKIWEDINTLMG